MANKNVSNQIAEGVTLWTDPARSNAWNAAIQGLSASAATTGHPAGSYLLAFGASASVDASVAADAALAADKNINIA